MIYFFGDIHSNFDRAIDVVVRDRPDAIVLLGDMECTCPLHEIFAPIRQLTDIWYIHGNHDTDRPESWQHLAESELAGWNLHGRFVNIAGINVAGLGGIFRREIWYPPESPNFTNCQEFDRNISRQRHAKMTPKLGGKRLKHQSTIFPDVYANLKKQRADILVTHEAPSCHPYGYMALDELATSMRVQKLFHGHHHDCLNYSEWSKANGINVYGIGLRGITDENGKEIVPGELDAVRKVRPPRREL